MMHLEFLNCAMEREHNQFQKSKNISCVKIWDRVGLEHLPCRNHQDMPRNSVYKFPRWIHCEQVQPGQWQRKTSVRRIREIRTCSWRWIWCVPWQDLKRVINSSNIYTGFWEYANQRNGFSGVIERTARYVAKYTFFYKLKTVDAWNSLLFVALCGHPNPSCKWQHFLFIRDFITIGVDLFKY